MLTDLLEAFRCDLALIEIHQDVVTSLFSILETIGVLFPQPDLFGEVRLEQGEIIGLTGRSPRHQRLGSCLGNLSCKSRGNPHRLVVIVADLTHQRLKIRISRVRCDLLGALDALAKSRILGSPVLDADQFPQSRSTGLRPSRRHVCLLIPLQYGNSMLNQRHFPQLFPQFGDRIRLLDSLRCRITHWVNSLSEMVSSIPAIPSNPSASTKCLEQTG